MDELNKALERADEILMLAGYRLQVRTIAKTLGLDRSSVKRVIEINSEEYKKKLKPLPGKLRRLKPPSAKKQIVVRCEKCRWADKATQSCHWPCCFAQTIDI